MHDPELAVERGSCDEEEDRNEADTPGDSSRHGPVAVKADDEADDEQEGQRRGEGAVGDNADANPGAIAASHRVDEEDVAQDEA